jgi:hypothetical protein
LSAQNRLSKLKLYGNDTSGLYVAESGEEGIYFAAFSNIETGAEIINGGEEVDFSAALELICPAELYDDGLKAGCFVVEYRPEDSVVSAVFYSDRSFDYSAASMMVSTADWRQWREESRVGYYDTRGLENKTH